jgi:hypothetical protein
MAGAEGNGLGVCFLRSGICRVKPLLILLGALFTGAASMSAGLLLLQRLSVKLHRQEVYPYAFILGASIYSLIIFSIAAAGAISTWTIAAAGTVLIAVAVRSGAWKRTGPPLPPMPVFWLVVFAGSMLVYGLMYLAYGMAPEMSPDGSTYHLGLVARYFRQHGFGWITTNMYANLTMGIEMLYLSAYSIGRHSSAAVVHFLFLLNLPLMILVFARRHGMPAAGATAGLLVFCSPVFGLDGSTAYIDVAMAAVVFCLFCFLQIWSASRERALLIPIGLLAGFAYAAKLTAFVAIPYAIGFVLYKLIRARRPLLRPLLTIGACAGAMVAPWLIKNTLIVGNPLSPFFNSWFPNPHVRISFEEEYKRELRAYIGIKSAKQIPTELTLRGGSLNGLLGPAFLLAPAALFAARWPEGRQVLLAGAVFASTYPANIGTRFIMAAVPFFALGMGMVLSHWRMATGVIAFHLLFSWPSVIPLYDAGSWRIDRFRVNEALRKVSEDEFLRPMLIGYPMAQLINQHVPRDGRVLAYGGVAEAYTEREVLICYQGGLNNVLCEIWASGTELYFQPSRHWNFRFPEISARRIRLVQTARTNDIWSVSELRVFDSAGEIRRAGNWRVKASVNPWDVQMAFDNSPTTRWKAWQRAEPGMFVEIDFNAPIKISGAVAAISGDNPETRGRIDVEVHPGRWQTVSQQAVETPVPPILNSRRNAIEHLKSYGITHLAMGRNEFLSVDLFRNRAAWGIEVVGETNDGWLYRLR